MMMFPATPQRTAENRSLAPTPMIADEMTWVVDTGIPKCDAPKMIVAAVVSAAKPWTGSSFTTRWPIVLMIRQPPAAVPSEIAEAAARITQSGTVGSARMPPATSARVMMPIVFCASFEPWLKAMYAAEMTWSRRNRSLIVRGWAVSEHVQEHDHQAEPDEDAEDRRGHERERGPCRRCPGR